MIYMMTQIKVTLLSHFPFVIFFKKNKIDEFLTGFVLSVVVKTIRGVSKFVIDSLSLGF